MKRRNRYKKKKVPAEYFDFLINNTFYLHQVPASLYAPVLLDTKAMVMDPLVVPRLAMSVRPTTLVSTDSVWSVLFRQQENIEGNISEAFNVST